MRGNQIPGLLIPLPLQKTLLYQLFNNASAGSRSSQPFALCFIWHIIRTSRLHALQKRIFCKMLWRNGLPFLYLCGKQRKSTVIPHGWQDVLFLFFLFRTAFLFNPLPSGRKNRFPLRFENRIAAKDFSSSFRCFAGLTYSCQKALNNQL